jgi:pyrroline-5-carboxylate reductase
MGSLQGNNNATKRNYSDLKIGFIGGGNMARAIIEGVLHSNLVEPSQIYISHPSAVHRKKFSYLNIENEYENNEVVLENCQVILLCVKPQMIERVCTQLIDRFDLERHFFVSIVAGVTLEKQTRLILGSKSNESELLSKVRIARGMLNTAALIGQSCSIFSQNGNLNEQDKRILNSLFESVGACFGEIKDSEMVSDATRRNNLSAFF